MKTAGIYIYGSEATFDQQREQCEQEARQRGFDVIKPYICDSHTEEYVYRQMMGDYKAGKLDSILVWIPEDKAGDVPTATFPPKQDFDSGWSISGLPIYGNGPTRLMKIHRLTNEQKRKTWWFRSEEDLATHATKQDLSAAIEHLTAIKSREDSGETKLYYAASLKIEDALACLEEARDMLL